MKTWNFGLNNWKKTKVNPSSKLKMRLKKLNGY